ncbi:MAG: LysR family transcriptional regulator [Psychrobium sp.]
MDKWTELRTAYKLAKLGTLSATALEIGVHRSTVMRHIDVLESNLRVKLFQRNDRGYIPTEAGLELMRLGEVTDDHFTQLETRLVNQEHNLSGTLTLTCVNEITRLLMPTINEYQAQHPAMSVDIIGDLRNFNLEYGEADLAIRAGPKPTTLDNIVMPLLDVNFTLCADEKYIERYGMPHSDNLEQHRFVALRERVEHLPWNEWVFDNIPENNIVIKSSSQQVIHDVILQGGGIGFAAIESVEDYPKLHKISLAQQWSVPVWILVHRDMFNLPKIRKFIDILKSQSQWDFSLR